MKRFEREMRNCPRFKETIYKYIDSKKKEEIDYKQHIKVEFQKQLPHKTSLMIGRTEIPKWIG